MKFVRHEKNFHYLVIISFYNPVEEIHTKK